MRLNEIEAPDLLTLTPEKEVESVLLYGKPTFRVPSTFKMTLGGTVVIMNKLIEFGYVTKERPLSVFSSSRVTSYRCIKPVTLIRTGIQYLIKTYEFEKNDVICKLVKDGFV